MDLITSGLELMPDRLSPRAIYCLAYHDFNKIEDQLYTVQIISIGDQDEQSFSPDFS